MARIALGLLLLALAAAAPAEQAPVRCAPRAMPAALDSVAVPAEAGSSVGFSATPTDYPGRAWVVRAARSGRGAASLEIVRLRRQLECNRYEIEARWQAPLPAAEYRALVEAVAPLGSPPAGAFSDDPGLGGEDLVLDGTGIELRLKNFGWEARRALHHRGLAGAPVSALFHALVAKHVPAAEVPAEDWRTRRPD